MKPGKKTDVLILEKVLGYTRQFTYDNEIEACVWESKDGSILKCPPPYSTDTDTALELAASLGDIADFELEVLQRPVRHQVVATLRKTNAKYTAIATTLPLAICIVVLKIVEWV